MYNEIRFFTPLRCDQNDREEGAAIRMTGKGGAVFRMTGKRARCDQNDRINLLIKSKTLCVSNVNTL